MDNEDGKNQVAHKTLAAELERLVKVRKYQHCEAEFAEATRTQGLSAWIGARSKLAKNPTRPPPPPSVRRSI